MAKKSKRVLSVLLTLIMILGLLPTSVFAYGQDQVLEDGYFTVSKDGVATEVQGVNQPVTDQGYTVSKTINQTGENAFDITLEVETTQTVKTSDAAVMLVIDVSNSMKNEMGNLKTAAKSFVDSLVENNKGGKVYVSVAAFKSYAYTVCGWTDVTKENGAQSVKNKIDTLYTSGEDDYGGTNLEAGLMLARNRLGMADVAGTSTKYTVLFTDGEPTYRVKGETSSTEQAGTDRTGGSTNDGSWSINGGTDCSEAERNEAVSMAGEVKELSKLYTICYGAGENILYGNDKCVNCGQPRSKHNERYEGWWPFGDYHYYCRDGSGKEYKSSSVTMSQYLENEIATPAADDVTYAYDAEDSAQLNAAFKDIASSVSEGNNGAGTKVVDPMGEFIDFGEVKNVKGGTASTDASGRTLTWTLDPTQAETSTEGGKTTYTFTLTYSITLDTAKEGFKENTNYPTNGYTRLEIPNGEDVVFNVPGVFGEIPTVEYTINYWYYDRDQKQYVKGDFTTRPADLWTRVNVDPAAYSKDNYTFDHGDSGWQTLEPGKLEFNLYYNPIQVSVVVNHWVITKEQTDEGYTFTGPVSGGSETYSEYCQGDKFTNEVFLKRDGLTLLEAGQSQVVNGTPYTTDDYTDVELTDKQTVINIYYIQDGGDSRTDVPYVIQYWYRNNAWELVDGKYQVVEGKYFKGEVAYGTAKHGDTITFADKADGYTLVEIEGSNGKDSFELTLDKAENPNVVNVYYSKEPTENPEEATLTIVHKFYLLGINGPELVETQYEMGSADGGDTVYVGETYTAEDRTPSGFTRMTSDAAMTKEMVSGSNEIVVEYYRDTLEETHVSVYHYYRTWAWEVDPETGDGEYVLVKEDMKPGHPDGTFYVGQTYQAVPNPDGSQLNEEESDLEARVLVQGDNVFQLYYDAYESKEEDAADVTVHHIYQTYRSYVNADGNVVLDELVDSSDEPEKTYYGVKGETFVAQLQEKEEEGYEFYKADTADLKVTLQGEDGDYYIYYKKTVNDLGDKVPVTVQPVYKTYTKYINDNGDEVTELKGEPEMGTPMELGQYYVGQKATALSTGYPKPGFSYDAADPDNTVDLTVEVTGEDDVITVVYKRVEDNRGAPVVLLVNNVYTTRTTYIENGEVKTSETSFTGQSTNYPIYLNQFIDLTNRGTKLPGYELDSTKTQPSGRVQVTEDGMLFTFYWVMEVDHTTPATVKVVHHYKIHDANPNVSDLEWTVGEDEAPVEAYAFQDYLLPYAYEGQFQFSNVTDVQHNGVSLSERVAVELTSGDNRIDIYYVKNVDSRVPSSVKVIHNYYKDTDALAAGTTEASYEENIPAMEADKFTATLRLENGSLYYEFVSANPETYTVVVDDDAANNVITISYVRVDATYTVVHEYYSNGDFVGSVESSFGGKVGDTISADDIDKLTEYDGRTYRYRSADPETMVLVAGDDNVMTLRYTRSSGGGGGGGGSTDPDPDPDPGTDIEDPDVPTTDLPDVPGETTDPVEEPVEIEEPEVPMAEAPETGDSNFAYLHLLSLASALGLVALFVSDKRSKKHRDEA